jgi:DNA-binding CsgD family transcriptional regulator
MLSRRTIEYHVGRVLAKLQLRSRVNLIRAHADRT